MEIVTSNTLYPLESAVGIPIDWRGLSIGSSAVAFERESRTMAPSSDRRLSLRQTSYSIRLPDRAGDVDCARCDTRFRAAGPTGHADELPICDLCLLECEKELGMVLALVSVVRVYASMRFGSAREHWEALEEVGAFAHVFEQVAAARSGPGRIFRPDLSPGS